MSQISVVLHQDQASWTTPEGAFVSSSNIVTVSEATLSLGVTIGGAILAWMWAGRMQTSS